MGIVLQLFTSETQLIQALSKNDAKAQRYLYDKYAARMLAVCNRYLPDRMEAEDVMIEGFMKIYQKIGQFKSEGSFEGWMRRLITNEALMQLRTKRHIEIDLDTPEAQKLPNYDQANQHLETEDLLHLIAQLPTGYRTVFNLYAIEGYSHAEIAEQLGITESTSKSQLHRARALLQQMLTNLEGEKDDYSNFKK
ncbi:MAG: sigma-70 family RNA polymerase sigma factor [Cytophagia bacterium]|nr:MAG: sigma-70 family RNA polymerase sigma factor [Runella sp.]TAG17400.1 MAG: sigma-70 family RNA polymerase sigma factor [Cytophagales bacterium]TAG39018.1 MAG: sigma-70 family RNA polymerase sigma factor [Cytophagia bacterium]TAG51219.1 MAG: sigma-70 family RNA polymerase sigma factor [Runella slithyformis]TAG79316.1 MAG: sigma-70 family RNA polymerase sigma factor [Cytophagales bacterium]